MNDLKSKMLNICDNSIECDLIDLGPECKNDFSSSENFEDNLIRRKRRSNTNIFGDNRMMLKRLKHAAKSGDEDKAKPKRKRERIEIRFKFIGEKF